MFGEYEHHFHCPYCMAPISMVLETLYGEQSYVEDCEVCCSPIEVSFKFSQDLDLSFFSSEKLN